MMVVCHKKGLVEMGICGACSGFEKPDPDNPWGNPPGTCAHFRFIKRTPEEEAEMGIKMLYPGSGAHERASKELAQTEDRDVDHNSKRLFPIAKPIETPAIKPRKVA